MKSLIRDLSKQKGVDVLSRKDQKTIVGQAQQQSCDLSLCGCDCAGGVTGPACCHYFIACLQVYLCYDDQLS